MKNILLLVATLLFPAFLHAQSREFMEFYEKYSGREGYTIVDMSGEAFLAMSGTNLFGNSSPDEKVNRIMLIVVEDNKPDSFGKDVRKMLKKGDYKNISIVYESGQCVEFYTKGAEDGDTEFIMYSSDETEQVIIFISGKGLSLNSISRIAGDSDN